MTVAVLLCGVSSAGSAQQLLASQAERLAHAPPTVKRVTLALRDVTLQSAVRAIAEQADRQIVYKDALLPRKVVSVQLNDIPVDKALETVLVGTGLSVRVSLSGLISLVPDDAGRVGEGTIVGKVINAKTKQPVVGASITVGDGERPITTGEDGTFRLTLSAGEHGLSVRAVGFLRQTRRVRVTDGETITADFTLDPSASVLNEVIVTGTVVATERKAIPTPITVIHGEDLEKRGITRIEQLFRGEIPGLLVMERGSATYDATAGGLVTSKIYSRGSSKLDGSANPIKTYIDGVELLDPSYLGTIDPKSIERIEVITGPQAATVYGSGAMGGVMQIFTKKGRGQTRPQATVSLKYGLLQSNFSERYTPTHTDGLTLTGGVGPAFTYSTSLSYNYSGQWQPKLWARMIGGSAGVATVQGPVTVSGSYNLTGNTNGTWRGTFDNNLMFKKNLETGRYFYPSFPAVGYVSQQVSTATSQTVSATVDYRATSVWQHHLTLGRSQNNFALEPNAPAFASYSNVGSDTLYSTTTSTGGRVSGSYNMTLLSAVGPMSSTVTLGATGSSAERTYMNGCTVSSVSTTMIGCYSGSAGPDVNNTLSDKSWGGFGTVQLGLFSRLFLTLGLRGERNPTYGEQHKIDWTPTNGVTYTAEVGDWTVKLLGSYGRATRPPLEEYRREIVNTYSNYEPSQWAAQLAAPEIRPEYSRGPQGGIEIYYGNRGSLTVNHYSQTIDGLIESVAVDSFPALYLPTNTIYMQTQYQYQNVAKISQSGWEGTASLVFGPVTWKGTYSWNASKIKKAWSPYYQAGTAFLGIPTHTANMVVGYARGRTSATLTTNYVGAIVTGDDNTFLFDNFYLREKMYVQNYRGRSTPVRHQGYAKSDIALSQRLTSRATVTLNVLNAANNFDSESGSLNPALGRQTSLGLSIRMP